MSDTPEVALPFVILARIEGNNLVQFVAERDGEQVAIERYHVGTGKRRRAVAEKWAANELLVGKVKGKHRLKLIGAIERELEASELRAMKELDARRQEENEAIEAGAVEKTCETEPNQSTSTGSGYIISAHGIRWLKPIGNGMAVEVPLTNFIASIVADVVRDAGLETTRALEIEARLCSEGAGPRKFTIPVSRFAGMGWAVEELGPRAIVYPGFAIKDHSRTAIQIHSRNIVSRRIYTHTGWRRIGNEWLYLHCGGAIGLNGPVTDIEVSLPGTLSAFRLPIPPQGEELRKAVRASLRLLTIGPLRITAPIVGAVYRSAIDRSDQTVSLFGHTGVFKTELAALAQQHFGAGFNARSLPASWSSTGNALEGLAFTMKDTVLVIDDFAPGGSPIDVARYHKEADRVLRAQGNNSGRGRLRPDGEPRATRYPRGLIITTGEDVPRGESLRARQFIVEIRTGDVSAALLTEAQAAGANGNYAAAMAGFLQWAAGRLDALRSELKTEVARVRSEASLSSHRRTADIVAHLGFGLKMATRFAVEIGAITNDEGGKIVSDSWAALTAQADGQGAYIRAADPARRYLELLRASIVAGDAHLSSSTGDPPDDAGRWGWTAIEDGMHGRKWRPRGDCIGWLDGDNVCLEPTAAYRVAQKMAGMGEGLSVSERTLRKRLADGGWLASTDRDRGKITIRRTMQGVRREVLHLYADRVMSEESAQPAQTAHDVSGAVGNADSGPIPWAGSGFRNEKPAHKTGPISAEKQAIGSNGLIGPVAGTYNGSGFGVDADGEPRPSDGKMTFAEWDASENAKRANAEAAAIQASGGALTG